MRSWRDPGQAAGVARHRRFGGGIEAEAELGDEPGRPQQAEGILLKALVGVADGAEDRQVEIGLTAEGVDQLAGAGIGRHGVDGEVAAGEIVLQGAAELDRRLAAGVGVMLRPVGGDLDEDPIGFAPKTRPTVPNCCPTR